MDFKIGLGGGGGGDGGSGGGGGAASSNNASSCSDDDNAPPSAKVARTTSTSATTQQQQAQSFHQLMMLRKQQQCCSPTDSTAASSGEDALLASSSRPHQQLMLPPPPPTPAHHLSPLEQQQHQGLYQYKQTGCGGMQLAMSLQEAALGPRYPFSAVQWAELEHQALVFKYMMARVPPPPELIAPIRKSVAALQGLFHAGSTTTAIGGTHVHHLDLEPGRCRRTDGKKWRCARPIVPDQKYCERHINRGKHKRSNKNSSSSNNASTNDNNANRNANSSNQSSSQPVAVGGGGGLVPAVEPLQSRYPVATGSTSSTFGVGEQPATSSMASLSQPMRSFSSVNGSQQHLLQQQRQQQQQQQLYMGSPNLSSKDRFLSGPVCSEQLLFSEVSGSTKPAVATTYVRPQTGATQSTQYYYESRTPTSTTTTEEGDAFYVSSGSSSFLQQRDRQQQHSYLASQQQEDVKRLKPLFKEWPSTSSSNSDEKDNGVNESGVNLSMSGRDEQDYTSAMGGPLAEALHKAGGEQRQRSSDDKPTAFWLSGGR